MSRTSTNRLQHKSKSHVASCRSKGRFSGVLRNLKVPGLGRYGFAAPVVISAVAVIGGAALVWTQREKLMAYADSLGIREWFRNLTARFEEVAEDLDVVATDANPLESPISRAI